MAFKVLDEEQIALLTENQKKQYENELDMYHARSAFIEKMQILENAEIKPYEPKLQSIAVIDEIPEKAFHKPEYTVKTCAPASKPKTQFHTPEFQEPASVVLPKCTPIPIAEIKIGSIKKAEVIQPKLPRGKKAKPVAKTFEPIERNQARLLDIRRPNMDLVVLSEQAAKIPKTSPANIPSVSVPGAPAVLFIAPEKTAPILPEAAVNITGIKSKSISKFEQPQLPRAVKPSINAKEIKMETIQAILPELSNIEYTNTEFNRPEIPDAELPLVSKPDFAVREIQPLEHPALDLPSVGKPNMNVRTFRPTQYKQPELPIVEKISAGDINFEPIEKAELNITITPVSIAAVKAFKKVEGKAKGLPIKAAVRIPDAQETLKELFAVKSDSEVLEETGS